MANWRMSRASPGSGVTSTFYINLNKFKWNDVVDFPNLYILFSFSCKKFRLYWNKTKYDIILGKEPV